MKQTMALITALALAALLGCGKSEEGANTLVIQNYIGTVSVQGPGGSRNAEIGGSVAAGETIITGGISSADLVYNESALIRVNEHTSLRVDSVIAGMKKSTDLSLQKGSVFNTVSKLKDDENFRVSTPTMVIAVRGTSFRVSTDAQSSETDVLAGTVEVNPVRDGKVVTDISDYVRENNRAEIRKAQVQEIIRSRKIAVAAIRAERMKRLRDDLNGIDGAVVDRLNPGLRKEFRMKLLQMKQDRFEMMEKNRVERIHKFLEIKKLRGARIREHFIEKSLKQQGYKSLFEKLRDKKIEGAEKRRENKEGLVERLREKRIEQAEKRQEKKEERAEKLRDKKEELMEKLRTKKMEADEKRKDRKNERTKKREERIKKRRGGN